MRLITHQKNFVCALRIVILSGSFFAHVAFADHEPKTTPAPDEQLKTFETAKTETVGQSDSTGSQSSAPQEPKRRALPAPLDPLFPGSEYLGPTPLIGVSDTDPEYPLEKALWSVLPALKANRIKVYGWVNAGFDLSTSNKSNIPESYAIVPNKLELDQAVLRFERLPDTVQRDHVDWGDSASAQCTASTIAGPQRKVGSADNSSTTIVSTDSIWWKPMASCTSPTWHKEWSSNLGATFLRRTLKRNSLPTITCTRTR
jgi:hypothetical protein